jgi:hypothetical protein
MPRPLSTKRYSHLREDVSRWCRAKAKYNALTKQADQAEIDEKRLVSVFVAHTHQEHHQEDCYAKIRLELPSRDESPDLVGVQLWVVVTGAEDDRDTTSNRHDNAESISWTKLLVQ